MPSPIMPVVKIIHYLGAFREALCQTMATGNHHTFFSKWNQLFPRSILWVSYSYFFLRKCLRQTRLASNSLYSREWVWTPNSSTSISWELGLQSYTTCLDWSAWSHTKDLLYVRQAFYQPRYMPIPEYYSLENLTFHLYEWLLTPYMHLSCCSWFCFVYLQFWLYRRLT